MNFTELKFFRHMIDFNKDSNNLSSKEKEELEKSMEKLIDSIFINIINNENINNEFEFYNDDVIEFPLHNKEVYLTDILSPHWQLLSDIDKKYIKKLIKDISIKYDNNKKQMDQEIHKLLCIIHNMLSIFTIILIKKSVKKGTIFNFISYTTDSFLEICENLFRNKRLKFKISIMKYNTDIDIIYNLDNLNFNKMVLDDKTLDDLIAKLNDLDIYELIDIISVKSDFREFVNHELNKKEKENEE